MTMRKKRTLKTLRHLENSISIKKSLNKKSMQSKTGGNRSFRTKQNRGPLVRRKLITPSLKTRKNPKDLAKAGVWMSILCF